MEMKDIQQDSNTDDERSIALSIRTSKEKSKYMKDNKISPTKLFNKALDELMDPKL